MTDGVAPSERSDGRDDSTFHAHRFALSVPPADNSECATRG